MILLIRYFKSQEDGIFLFHKRENAIRQLHEWVKEHSFFSPEYELLPVESYMENEALYLILLEEIDSMNEGGGNSIEIRVYAVDPQDLSDEDNKVPRFVEEISWREYKGIRYQADHIAEINRFQHHINEMEHDWHLDRFEILYFHRGMFFYKLRNDAQFHIDYLRGSESFDTIQEMKQFIDKETGK